MSPTAELRVRACVPAGAQRGRIPRLWILLLALPALIPLLQGLMVAKAAGRIPTPFVQYDMPYYLANARAQFSEGWQLTYPNPYAPYDSPALYFQPHTLLLGLLLAVGLSPEVVWLLYGLAALAFGSWAACRLYENAVGWNTAAEKTGLVCFFWGGGLLGLAGMGIGAITGVGWPRSPLLLDPMNGWWMLNFGRNLVNPNEAYYHGLFLLALLLVKQERYWGALALGLLLSASHPFSGLSLALVLVAAFAIELGITRDRRWIGATVGAFAIVALHVLYYLLFLNRFEVHRSLREQWALDWSYPAWTFVPALYIVGSLALMRVSRWKAARELFGSRDSRLFLVCFAIIFGLSHHDLLVRPVQPIHFAHGYDWIALFFLAAPVLMRILERVWAIAGRTKRLVTVGLVLSVVLSDNLLWFASFAAPKVQIYALSLRPAERDLLDWFAAKAPARAYVASGDEQLNYLVPTYTGLRPWFGHMFNTPHAAEREAELQSVFRNGGSVPTASAVYYVPLREWKWQAPPGAQLVHTNSEFQVWYVAAKGG